MKIKNVSLVLVLSLLASSALAGNQRLIADSLRKQSLQKSAQVWANANVLPLVRSSLTSVDSFGVSVTEPRAVLPPSLGGPLKYVEVLVEVRASGWGLSRYGQPRYYPDVRASVLLECRYQQKLWALIDQDGRPTQIMGGQKSLAAIACANGPFLDPEYHGMRRRY